MKSEKEILKLNWWIAEHVMGFDLRSKPFEFFKTHDCIYFPEKGKCAQTFKPATDPAAAMLVLEKCAGETTTTIRKQSNGSFCVWWTESENMKENYIMGETLPLAICLFAKELFSK